MVVVLAVTRLAARRAGRHSVIDAAWGLMFCAIALVSFAASTGTGNAARRGLILAMTLIWGLRLTGHLARRNRGKAEDPRYAALLDGHGRWFPLAAVYLPQGALAFGVSMPIQVAVFQRGALTPLAWVGVGLWLLGMAFEAVGDAQLARFTAARADPDRPAVLDTGLWRYTRHPNYFGDACVWVGIFLVTVGHWPGPLTAVSLAVMIYLLAFGSGKALLERAMAERPGYRDYMRRTSGFVPLPPRRR